MVLVTCPSCNVKVDISTAVVLSEVVSLEGSGRLSDEVETVPSFVVIKAPGVVFSVASGVLSVVEGARGSVGCANAATETVDVTGGSVEVEDITAGSLSGVDIGNVVNLFASDFSCDVVGIPQEVVSVFSFGFLLASVVLVSERCSDS